MTRVRCTAWLLGLASLCAQAAPLDEVFETDRAFARHALAHGAQAAFVAYAADDAILFRPGVGPVRGRAAIGAVFAGTTAVPRWAPSGGEVGRQQRPGVDLGTVYLDAAGCGRQAGHRLLRVGVAAHRWAVALGGRPRRAGAATRAAGR
jgi:hypothetical protein